MAQHRRPTPLPFDPESVSWLDGLKRAGASASTIESYGCDLRAVASAIGSDDVAAITRIVQADIERISVRWITSGSAASTIFRRFSGLRSFARFLSLERSHDCSRLLSSRSPPCGRVRREPIAGESIDLILSSSVSECDEAWTSKRDCAVVHVAASSGLTTAEIVGLNRGDYKPRLAAIVVRGSHLKDRPAPLSYEAVLRLACYLEEVPFDLTPNDALFVTARRSRLSARSLQLAFRRFRGLAGVARPAVLSSLRNAIGANLARSGASPEVLAAALGISVASAWRFCETQESSS